MLVTTLSVVASTFQNPLVTTLIGGTRQRDKMAEVLPLPCPAPCAIIKGPTPDAPQRPEEEKFTGVTLIAVPPLFKLVFLSVLGIAVLSGIGAASIAFAGEETLTPNQQSVFEAANTAWKMGLGVIFGLLGGKAA